MSFLNQSNFPRLWLLFQMIVGGTADKRRLAIRHYRGQKRVLEIGCAAGNVSGVFTQFPDIEFTGIDIDDNALEYARRRFASAGTLCFKNVSLSDLAKTGEKFDYVLFANMLHHVDDETALLLLREVHPLLSDGAALIIMEPERIREDYGILFKVFYAMEQGKFRRHERELTELIRRAGLGIKSCNGILVAPNALPFLKVGRITLIEAVVP